MCRCLLLLSACLNVLPCFAGVLVSPDSTWRFFKGYSEASTPDTAAWRQLGFDDSAWGVSQAAYYYENDPGSSTACSGNTVLADIFLNTSGGTVAYTAPVGGNYFGLYTVEEKTKRGKDRVDIVKLEPEITNAPAITGQSVPLFDPLHATNTWQLQGAVQYTFPLGVTVAP